MPCSMTESTCRATSCCERSVMPSGMRTSASIAGVISWLAAEGMDEVRHVRPGRHRMETQRLIESVAEELEAKLDGEGYEVRR